MKEWNRTALRTNTSTGGLKMFYTVQVLIHYNIMYTKTMHVEMAGL